MNFLFCIFNFLIYTSKYIFFSFLNCPLSRFQASSIAFINELRVKGLIKTFSCNKILDISEIQPYRVPLPKRKKYIAYSSRKIKLVICIDFFEVCIERNHKVKSHFLRTYLYYVGLKIAKILRDNDQ